MRAAVVVVLGMLLTSADARASCGIPQWVGTADGTPIPATGVLFVHNESMHWQGHAAPDVVHVLWEHGHVGSATVTREHHANWSIARVEYSGQPGTTLTIRGGGSDHTFPIVADWHAPRAAPRVLQAWHYTHEWTCSYADSLMFQIDQPVAAVRARWTFAGRTKEVIEAMHVEDTQAVLELGKINCGYATIPAAELAEGGELELFAIRLDGSEVKISGMPHRISMQTQVQYSDLLATALTLVYSDHPRAQQAKRTHRPIYGVLVLVLAVGGLALVYLLLSRAQTAANDC